MAGLFLCPIIAAVMRCMGLYCVRGTGYNPANIMPIVGRSVALWTVCLASYPALLSFGCSLLTGARGAFNRVVFRTFGGTVTGAKCY